MLKNERRECWSGSPDSPSWFILLPALPSRRGFCQRDAFQGTTTTSTSTSTRSHEFWWVQWGTNKVHSGIHPQMLRLQQDTRNQLQFLIRCSVLCIFVPSSAISPALRPHAPAPSSVPSLPLLTERAGVPGSLASAQSAHRCDFLWVVLWGNEEKKESFLVDVITELAFWRSSGVKDSTDDKYIIPNAIRKNRR